MSRFKQSGKRSVPSLNTSSLPDLIFTLLFFFILVSNMREEQPEELSFRIPTAYEIQKLEKAPFSISIYVGQTEQSDDEPGIYVNNTSTTLQDLPKDLEKEKKRIQPEYRHQITILLKIDEGTKMGIVEEIKNVLRTSELLKINYIVKTKQKREK